MPNNKLIDNHVNINEILIEVNNFINDNIEYHDQIDQNIIELEKLSNVLIDYEDIIDLQFCKSIIITNEKLRNIIKNIVIDNKNNDDIYKFNHPIIYNIIDVYCMLEDVKLKEIDDQFDDIASLDDITKIYLLETRRIPLLTVEEEKDLLIKIAQGDKNARKKFIESNLRLVISIAKYRIGKGIDFIDLIQEGNIGLMMALEKFDVNKGFKFSTYATWWIRRYIDKAISDKGRNVRLPIHVIEHITKYDRAMINLENSLGRNPTDLEVAEYLNLSLRQIEKIKK